MRPHFALVLLLGALGCEPSSRGGTVVKDERVGLPLDRATAAEKRRFVEGDRLFDVVFRAPDGLGPLFIRNSCGACHRDDGRGPGLVAKMAVLASDGRRAADQSRLRHGDTQRPYVSGGAKTNIAAPADAQVRTTYRLPPAVFGRGYIEAIDESELQRVAREAATRSSGVRGRPHMVGAQGAKKIGRFGLKARLATLDDFTADAFAGDMGLTSPQRPSEVPNPDNLRDDDRPGVDLDNETVAVVADYVRLLELPPRKPEPDGGRALFASAGCATCHTPSLHTRADFPVQALRDIDAPVFSDLLLHDMGASLSDDIAEGDAGSREWRTAPLIGVRFLAGLLHDGRARTVADAITAHAGVGSEANDSVAAYRALSDGDRATLVAFVEGL